MAWLVLVVAGLLEVGWAIGAKYTDGWTRFWPSVLTLVLLVLSMTMLFWAIKHLPVGTAYAVWTGIGAVGTATYGILFMNESASPGRLLAIALIIVGIVMLKVLPNGSG